jgi:hypothetical protein
MGAVNKGLGVLLERVASWPEEAQAELLKSVIDIEARHSGMYHLSDDERAAVEEGLEQAKRREFVSDEEMAAFFQAA